MISMRGWIDEIILDTVVRKQIGDILYLPADMVHGGTLGPFGCDAIDVCSPPRADYEAKRQDRMTGYHAIIPEDSKIQTVADGGLSGPGLTFTEGPVWVNGKLYFSNMHFDTSWNGSPSKSTLVEMDPDGTYRHIVQGKMQSNGIIGTSKNTLLVCDMFGTQDS
jgi:gluconolactonase